MGSLRSRHTKTDRALGRIPRCSRVSSSDEMSSDSGERTVRPARIISGGQTGVDRAALDVAIELGIPHGGWCPKGRRAEDGTIPARYRLDATETSDYAFRTERNVLDSDGTLIFYRTVLRGGTALTAQLAQQHGKPCFLFDIDQPEEPETVWRWLRENTVRTLNVAGPRESQNPGIASQTERLLRHLLR